jgi:hypothetical protein
LELKSFECKDQIIKTMNLIVNGHLIFYQQSSKI